MLTEARGLVTERQRNLEVSGLLLLKVQDKRCLVSQIFVPQRVNKGLRTVVVYVLMVQMEQERGSRDVRPAVEEIEEG